MSKNIDVEKLSIYYGSFLAVEGVTMSIRPQTVTALIGPSGCGKSTFLRSINRMHEVIPGARVEGRLALDGRDLYGPGVDPVGVRRQVGMVFQRPNPFPTMSIYDNVAAGVRLNARKMKRADLDDLVELLPALDAVEPQPRRHVVVDRHRRERVGPLEHHAHHPAHRDRVHPGPVQVGAVEGDVALDVRAGNHLVHPVQRPQHSGLAAAGGADERGDRLRLDAHRHVLDGLERAVVDVQVLDVDALRHDFPSLAGETG